MIFYDILRVLQMVKPQKRNPWMEKDNSPSIPDSAGADGCEKPPSHV